VKKENVSIEESEFVIERNEKIRGVKKGTKMEFTLKDKMRI